jgi:hypothetical protein
VIAPPRFVRCSSTSPFVIVSAFSAKVGAASVGAGEGEVAETGAREADGDAPGEVAAEGELLAVAEGNGAATIGAGGGKCVAV